MSEQVVHIFTIVIIEIRFSFCATLKAVIGVKYRFWLDSAEFNESRYISLRFMSYYVPVVLYGCETWTHTLRKKCRLRISENRVLRSIFWPKEDEVTQKRRRPHKEELYVLYSSPNIIWVIKSRRLRWEGHVARMGRGEVQRGFIGKSE